MVQVAEYIFIIYRDIEYLMPVRDNYISYQFFYNFYSLQMKIYTFLHFKKVWVFKTDRKENYMSVNGILLGQNNKNDNENDLNFKFYKTFSTSGNSWSDIDLPNGYIYKIFINKLNDWGNRYDFMNLQIQNDSTNHYYYYPSSFLTSYNPSPWGVNSKESSRNNTFNLIGESPYNNTASEAPLYLTICALPSKGWCIVQYLNSLKKFVEWKVTSSLSLSYYDSYQTSGRTIAQIYRTPFKF